MQCLNLNSGCVPERVPHRPRPVLDAAATTAKGAGYVAECDGQYADALSRNIGVSLLLVETTGALGAAFMTILRILAKQTRLSGVAWTKVPVGFRYSVVKFPQSFRHFLAGVLRKQAGGRPGPTPS